MAEDSAATITCCFTLDIEGHRCDAEVVLPNREITLGEFLPIVLKLQDKLIDLWVQLRAAEGQTVSCRAGCGACCRQLVPISEIEAQRLTQVVHALPADHRERVLRRFAEAEQALSERGLRPTLDRLSELSHAEKHDYGVAYFKAGIACPFLEDESCSIHSVRPAACREYLVTSPPSHCAAMKIPGIETVRHSATFSTILRGFGDGTGLAPPVIVPLVLALDATRNDDPRWAQTYPAPELLQHFLKCLAYIFSKVE